MAVLCQLFYTVTSAVRTKELEAVGLDNGFTIKRIPKYFEVRWTDFSYNLFSSMLSSWQALVSYLQKSNDVAAKGHLENLTDVTTLKTMCCVANILLLYSRFQKKLQDNKCTYFDWDDSVENVINRLEMLKGQNLLGSWESRFTENFKPSEQRFLGFQLFQKTRRNNHSLVPTTREFTAVRFEIIESLISFLKERYTLDSGRVKDLNPLKKLDRNVTGDQLKQCHAIIIPDLDLSSFVTEYREACLDSTL